MKDHENKTDCVCVCVCVSPDGIVTMKGEENNIFFLIPRRLLGEFSGWNLPKGQIKTWNLNGNQQYGQRNDDPVIMRRNAQRQKKICPERNPFVRREVGARRPLGAAGVNTSSWVTSDPHEERSFGGFFAERQQLIFADTLSARGRECLCTLVSVSRSQGSTLWAACCESDSCFVYGEETPKRNGYPHRVDSKAVRYNE